MPAASGVPIVRLTAISKRFGEVVAVHPLDLTINRGDFLAILGPSGCGKTTLLNLVAGFLFPDTGTIEIAGKDMTRIGPERRPTNMVFQSYGLFPHMTVRQNIAYGPRIAKMVPAEIEQRVGDIIELVDLKGLGQRNVTQLSGGQQQRVALARALIMRPEVLLLDEPLAALDLKLRKAMQEELRRIHRSIGGTFVFVTHDQGEAMGLANRIAVMQDGRLVQDGSAEEIYKAPKTLFVSTFIGDANVLSGRRRQGRVVLDIGASVVDPGPDEAVVCIVRPEVITIASHIPEDSWSDEVVIKGRIEDRIFLGSYVRYAVRIGPEQLVVHGSDLQIQADMAVGSEIAVKWRAGGHRILAKP